MGGSNLHRIDGARPRFARHGREGQAARAAHPRGHGGGLPRRRRTARARGGLAARHRGVPGRQGGRLRVHDIGRQRLLDSFLAREAGRPLRGAPANALPPDYVTGATISARAMRAAVLATAGLVLRGRVARSAVTVPTLDAESYSAKSWDELLAEGAVVRRRVTSGEVAAALAEAGASNVKLEVPLRKADDLYIELMTALFTPAAIGANLIGVPKFEDYKRQMPSGGQAIFVASNGPYDFLGTKYFRESEGHRFDRLRLVQDGRTFGFVQDDYTYPAGFKGQQNAGVFALPA